MVIWVTVIALERWDSRYILKLALTELAHGLNTEIGIKDNAHIFCLSSWVISGDIY